MKKFIDFRFIFTIIILSIMIMMITEISATRKRCFACRSRGNLGDCK